MLNVAWGVFFNQDTDVNRLMDFSSGLISIRKLAKSSTDLVKATAYQIEKNIPTDDARRLARKALKRRGIIPV